MGWEGVRQIHRLRKMVVLITYSCTMYIVRMEEIKASNLIIKNGKICNNTEFDNSHLIKLASYQASINYNQNKCYAN